MAPREARAPIEPWTEIVWRAGTLVEQQVEPPVLELDLAEGGQVAGNAHPSPPQRLGQTRR